MTKNTSANNITASKSRIAKDSLSMPTVSDFSLGNRTLYPHLSKSSSLNDSFSSTVKGPLSLSSNTIMKSIPPQNNDISNYIQNPSVPNKNVVINNYTPSINNANYYQQPDITKLVNHCESQITPILNNSLENNAHKLDTLPLVDNVTFPAEQNISRLINNCNLQITPALTENAQLPENTNAINHNFVLPSPACYSSQSDVNMLVNRFGPQASSSLAQSNRFQPESALTDLSVSALANPFDANKYNENEAIIQTDLAISKPDKISFATLTDSKTIISGVERMKDSLQREKLLQTDNNQTIQKSNENDSHLEKEYRELEALSILSIVDLEKNPKASLLLRIEINNKQIEDYSKDKNKQSNYLNALKSKDVLMIAKKWLIRFGSFTRLSEHFLKEKTCPLKTPLQIKKEFIEEEAGLSSCQFAENSSVISEPSNVSDFSNIPGTKLANLNSEPLTDVNYLTNLETQVDSIANQLNSAGVDCTIPIPGMTVMPSGNSIIPPNTPRNDLFQESRETPSRGSGPITPARPESAASHTEESVLTHAQIKKEKMESTNPSLAQCAYSSGNNFIIYSSAGAILNNPPIISQSVGCVSPHVSNSMSQVISQTIQTSVSQSVLSPNLASRSNAAPNVSLIPNVSYGSTLSSQPPSINIQTLPQNASGSVNFMGSRNYTGAGNVSSISGNNYNNTHIQNNVNYQNQVPPNRTVIPFTASQNISKFLMNLSSKSINQNLNTNVTSSSPNMNLIFRNGQQGGQVFLQQPRQPANQPPVYNVQQVHLPNKSTILQQTLNAQNRVPPQTANQYLVRQTPINTSINTLTSETVMLNNNSNIRNNVQPNIVYSLQNSAPQYSQSQSLNSTVLQQANSSGTTAAFLLQNSNKQPTAVAESNIADMFCALCGKTATLRCKQCTKVAYCNATCAKTYWHTKHKMECRPLDGAV